MIVWGRLRHDNLNGWGLIMRGRVNGEGGDWLWSRAGADAPPPRTLVVQPLPGVGDMIQLIPALRGIAAADPAGSIDIVTVRGFPAAALFEGADYVAHVAGLVIPNARLAPTASGRPRLLVRARELAARLAATRRLSALIRRGGYERVVILGSSWRYALAARLAGVRGVSGYGSALQRPLLTQGLAADRRSIRKLHPQRLGAALILLRRLGMAPLGIPVLVPDPGRRAALAAAWASVPSPWYGIAVGSTDPLRIWPPDRTARVLDALWQAGHTGLFLFATRAEAPLIDQIMARCRQARPQAVVGAPLSDVVAHLSLCQRVFATDSGLMNIAASLGVETDALFGTVRPYDYWTCLHPIVPDAGIDPRVGVSLISVDTVLRHLRDAGVLC